MEATFAGWKREGLIEDVIVETTVDEITNLYIIFDQKVINKKTNEILTRAKVKGVAVKEGKLLRNLKTLLNKE